MDKLILIFLLICLSLPILSGQIKLPPTTEKVRFVTKNLSVVGKNQNKTPPPKQVYFAFVKKDHQYENFAIFCKLEHKLQLKARIPIKFRLGTLDYVNKLEGKY